MIDGNTQALNEYLYSQEVIDKEFELTKQEKCCKIVEYAVKIMRGHCTNQEYTWAFDIYLLGDDTSELESIMDDWELLIENEKVKEVCLLALEASSQLLYDTELSEIAYFNESDWTNIMVDEVITMGGGV